MTSRPGLEASRPRKSCGRKVVSGGQSDSSSSTTSNGTSQGTMAIDIRSKLIPASREGDENTTPTGGGDGAEHQVQHEDHAEMDRVDAAGPPPA
ncbi:MAG: hypothetical protein R3D28_20135 [Geminicoccaceae bacterium]